MALQRRAVAGMCVGFLLFDPSVLQEFRTVLSGPLPPVLSSGALSRAGMDNQCRRLYEAVNRELSEKQEGYEAAVAGELLRFMAHCRRHYRLEEASEEEELASGSPKIAKLLDYINAHYMEGDPALHAAEIMGL